MEKEFTLIQLSEDTKWKLMKLKVELKLKTYEDVVLSLIKMAKEVKK